jgi:hypothetical protein
MSIPYQAVYGFANCGRGFYSEFMYALNKGNLLSGDIRYPRSLVVGDRFIRTPMLGKEQMYHFLFHLRMTMRYLAENPIGKKTTLSSAEVARMLTELPRRAAFVRSGEDVGVIYTDNAPPYHFDMYMRERMFMICYQTQTKYCTSLRDKQEETQKVEKVSVNRWEEVE